MAKNIVKSDFGRCRKKSLWIYPRIMAVVIFSVLIFSGCGIFYKPAFRGRVTDAKNGNPIKGAVVVVKYNKGAVIGGPAGASSYVQGVRETLTDENGEFRIPLYFALIPFCMEEITDFVIFRPGYGSFPGYQTSPPVCMRVRMEDFFSEDMFGIVRKAKCFSMFQEPETTEISVIFGLVKLPKLKTWEERRKASAISIGCSESKCPLLHRILKEEEKWLYENQERRK